jgi:very-short-patch-repair endonuclease
MVWSLLKGNQLDGIAFRCQHPLGPYIVDFYCHAARLVIEVDGSTHQGDQLQHDRKRDAWMRERGVQVLRVPAREVLENLAGVHATIRQQAHQRIEELSQSP